MTNKLQIYVATSWRNPHHAELVRLLRDAGHGVYDFKTKATAFDWRDALPTNANDPTIHSEPKPLPTASVFREMLLHSKARAAFDTDMDALKRADVVVALQPFGRSTAIELGWAAGARKLTAVLLADHQEPELMLLAADKTFTSYKHLTAWLTDVAQPTPIKRTDPLSPKTYAETRALLMRAIKDASSNEVKNELQALLDTVPTYRVIIKPEHVLQWRRDHEHRDPIPNEVGSHLSKTLRISMQESTETWKCDACGQLAWVDHVF